MFGIDLLYGGIEFMFGYFYCGGGYCRVLYLKISRKIRVEWIF